MKMIHKSLFAAVMATSSLAAYADDTTTLEFQLEATIPSERYYVQFNDPAFGAQPQEMAWNREAVKLDDVATQLRILNNSGKTTAYLQSAAVLAEKNAPTTTIPLTVTIDGQALPVGTVGAVEIVDDATTSEVVKPLVVTPTGSPTYEAGDYEGTVTMLFDHEL